MAGDFSNEDIAEHLRKGLLKCADPFTCPHGRPTIMEIEEKFLNRQFLR
jgi:DNA mismatch repair ATPase MutL